MTQQTEQMFRLGETQLAPGGEGRLIIELVPPDEGNIIVHDFRPPTEKQLVIGSLKLLFPEHLVRTPEGSEPTEPGSIKLLDLITPEAAPRNRFFTVNEEVIAVRTTDQGAVSGVDYRDFVYELQTPDSADSK